MNLRTIKLKKIVIFKYFRVIFCLKKQAISFLNSSYLYFNKVSTFSLIDDKTLFEFMTLQKSIMSFLFFNVITSYLNLFNSSSKSYALINSKILLYFRVNMKYWLILIATDCCKSGSFFFFFFFCFSFL